MVMPRGVLGQWPKFALAWQPTALVLHTVICTAWPLFEMASPPRVRSKPLTLMVGLMPLISAWAVAPALMSMGDSPGKVHTALPTRHSLPALGCFHLNDAKSSRPRRRQG